MTGEWEGVEDGLFYERRSLVNLYAFAEEENTMRALFDVNF